MAKSKKKQKRGNRRFWPLVAIGGVAILLIAVAGAWIFNSLNNPKATQSGTLPLEISVSEANAQREAGAFILDVREQNEWEVVHIPGATLIPLKQLESRLAELPADQPIVVVCRSGNRSAEGRDILLDNGFTQVTSMKGGMNEWAASGYETAAGK